MSRRKKVVLVANDVGGVGGMEKHLEEMIQRMKKDYDVTVVSSSLSIANRDGIRFIRVPTVRRPFPLMTLMFSTYASVRVHFLARNSMVHTTGAILFTKADVSTVHFCHAGWEKAAGQSLTHAPIFRRVNHKVGMWLKLWMERHCYNPAHTKYLVPVSQRVERELGEFYPYPRAQVKVISNGVDTEKFHPGPEQEKHQLRAQFGLPVDGSYLIFMGGDWERKGVRHLLEAFNQLAPAYPKLHVLIVGSGDAVRFGSYVEDKYIQRVHFLGKQPNPEIWYRMSDVFVFPSNYEACSLAVLEAAASGLAMVVTNVGGADDIVKNGQTGYFVERNADSIRITLQYLLDCPREIKRVGNQIRAVVESLTWDATYRQFLDLYQSIAREKELHSVEQPEQSALKSF
jgi:glycosyltransferase involved in cell wall biosynthesis